MEVESKPRDQDAERKQRSAKDANKGTMGSDVSDGDKVLLMRQKENKLSATYDPEPCSKFLREEIWWSLSEAKPYLRGTQAMWKGSSDPHQRNLNNSENQHSNWSRDHQWNQLSLLTLNPVSFQQNGLRLSPLLSPAYRSLVLRCQNRPLSLKGQPMRAKPSWLKHYVTWKIEPKWLIRLRCLRD